MAKKKEEGIVEKIEKGVEKTVKKAVKEVEELAEETAEAVEKALSGKKEKKAEKSEKDDKKDKLAALLKKAKAMEGKIEGSKDIDIKGKVKGEEEVKKDTLVPMEDYLKASIHLGTRVITPDMRSYVYRRRADGLAVFNTALLDDKIREGAEYLAQYAPEQIVVACKREAGWKAVNVFAETLGIKQFTKKYPAGTLTNPNLVDFFEKDLVFICDPWLDKNILADANKIKIKVLSVCDTNNFTQGIDHIIPGNNKSHKSLGMVFYLLTKLYIEKRKLKITPPPIQAFVEDWDSLQPS